MSISAALAHPASLPWRAWGVLGALSLLFLLITASTYSSLGVVLPAMVAEGHWNWAEGGLGFTLLGGACGASSYIPALMIRRIGVRATLLTGTAVMTAGFAALALTHGLPTYFAGAVLCGVGYQMMALIPATHVLAAVFRRRALAFGIYMTFGALGGVAGPWMVFAIEGAFHNSWRMFWVAQAMLAVIVGVVCVLVIGAPSWTAQRAALVRAAGEDQAGQAKRATRMHLTVRGWTVAQAVRTPQFYILLAAYFSHLLCGVTVASLSVAHLSQRGIDPRVAGAMLSFESLVQMISRIGGGLVGDIIDPRWLLLLALGAMTAGSMALSVADSYSMMVIYATGTGIGFGLTALAVPILLINYYGRTHNLEIFSVTCLVGAVSALGPFIGGFMRDRLGSFTPTFQLFAAAMGLVFIAALFMRPPLGRRGESAGAEQAPTELAPDAV